MYKVLGPYVRPIGRQLADGEMVHQAAFDRLALPECNYHPENLKAYLASGQLKVTNTNRTPRGKPCPAPPTKK
jgi:hypothetical protein